MIALTGPTNAKPGTDTFIQRGAVFTRMRIVHTVGSITSKLTLGAHAQRGYSIIVVCLSVCLSVCLCVDAYSGTTGYEERYQRLRNYANLKICEAETTAFEGAGLRRPTPRPFEAQEVITEGVYRLPHAIY